MNGQVSAHYLLSGAMLLVLMSHLILCLFLEPSHCLHSCKLIRNPEADYVLAHYILAGWISREFGIYPDFRSFRCLIQTSLNGEFEGRSPS